MAAKVTLSEIRTRCKTRADMTSSKFVEDSEWDVWINASAQALYDKLVEASEDYKTVSTLLVTNGTDKIYDLPDDFYKLRGLDYSVSGATRPMEKFVFRERHKYTGSAERIRYRTIGDQLHFEPAPRAQEMTLWYVPVFEKLTEDSDELDGVNGWEELIEIECAIKAKDKEESDTSVLQAAKQVMDARIEQMKTNRDVGMPERVTDVVGAIEDDLGHGWE